MDNRIKSFIELVASKILTNECVNGLCEFDSRCATKKLNYEYIKLSRRSV
jgi:hypothetical protein